MLASPASDTSTCVRASCGSPGSPPPAPRQAAEPAPQGDQGGRRDLVPAFTLPLESALSVGRGWSAAPWWLGMGRCCHSCHWFPRVALLVPAAAEQTHAREAPYPARLVARHRALCVCTPTHPLPSAPLTSLPFSGVCCVADTWHLPFTHSAASWGSAICPCFTKKSSLPKASAFPSGPEHRPHPTYLPGLQVFAGGWGGQVAGVCGACPRLCGAVHGWGPGDWR